MVVDPNKKRIVLLRYEVIRNLNALAKMHLDAKGTPRVLESIPLSDEFAETLQEATKAFDKVLDEIVKEEE